jgi:hypothetical protein
MLPFLFVLAVVGLLIFLGLRVCMFLYRSGTLRYNSVKRPRRKQSFPVDRQSEEAIADTEYLTSLVHSLER